MNAISIDQHSRKFTLFGLTPDMPDERLWRPVCVKKIALIWPKGFDSTYSIPLPYGYLKSNIDESKYEIRIIDNTISDRLSSDEHFKSDLQDFNPDLVGVSTWSPMSIEAIECLKAVKDINPEVITVIGGAHATSYHEKLAGIKGVDFLFRGEADLSFSVFLEQLEKQDPEFSKVKGLVYRGTEGVVVNDVDRENDLDKIKIPDYDSIQLDYYVRNGYRWNCPPKINAPVWITRGCPYRCGYCAAPELNGKPVRTHSIPYMVEWIKYLYFQRGVRWINILDDNFTYHKKYAKEFCRAVIDLKLKGLRFGTPNGIRMERGDKELWRLMKQAGWKMLLVAPETGSEKTIKRMDKDLDLKIVPRVVKEIQEAGLKVQGFLILGYPGESEKDLLDTRKLILSCKFNFVFMASFQPLPGTPIYKELVANKELVDGVLPHHYSDGTRAYMPDDLKDFNFPKFILITHLLMMMSNPLNMPYHLSLMFKLFSPRQVFKKIAMIFYYSLLPDKQGGETLIFSPANKDEPLQAPTASQDPSLIYPPMHQQTQSANQDD
jgi:anaerobic magnesium-protoporphyrin IX monomethyl ester cyclase